MTNPTQHRLSLLMSDSIGAAMPIYYIAIGLACILYQQVSASIQLMTEVQTFGCKWDQQEIWSFQWRQRWRESRQEQPLCEHIQTRTGLHVYIQGGPKK